MNFSALFASEPPEVDTPAIRPEFLQILKDEVRHRSDVRVKMRGLSMEEVEMLADALRGNPALTSLNLTSCFRGLEAVDHDRPALGDEGLRALAEVLQQSSLSSLSLRNNSMGVEGVTILVAVLRGSKLLSLDLDSNCIGDEGVQLLASALPHWPLMSLNLSRNYFSDRGVKALAAALQDSSVSSLDLTANRIGQSGGEALLRSLSHTGITDLRFPSPWDDYFLPSNLSEETRSQIEELVRLNRTRSFVLQMSVEPSETELRLTFRTMGGSIAAELCWHVDSPVQDLPKAVLVAMRSAGFKRLAIDNLRLVRPDGIVLETGPTAQSVTLQLGIKWPSQSTSSA